MNSAGHRVQVFHHLQGRVAAADDCRVLTLDDRQFLNGPVEKPFPQELFFTGNPEPPPGHAGSSDECLGGIDG